MASEQVSIKTRSSDESVEPGGALEAAVFLNRAVDRLHDLCAVHAQLAGAISALSAELARLALFICCHNRQHINGLG
jgi:hypothetical protein